MRINTGDDAQGSCRGYLALTDFAAAVFTEHARAQLARRCLDEQVVLHVLASPDTLWPVRPGRLVAHKVLPLGPSAQDYLVRVVVDIDRAPPEIVTAYRTSKLTKYRRP